MNFIDKMVERFIKLNRRMKRWQRVVSVMAAVVVFATTYALILPAITLDTDTATTQAGIEVAASENESDEAGTVFESEEEEEPAAEENVQEEVSEEAVAEENSGSESGSQGAEATQSEVVDDNDADEGEQTEVLSAEEAATYSTTEAAIAAVTGKTAEEIKLITEDTKLVFNDPDDEYVVTAEFGESAKLPEGVQLRVKEITKESDPEAYEAYYQKALSEMQDKYDENTKLSFAKFYDIAFIYEGTEIEPSGNVNVRIEYMQAVEIEKATTVDTIHFDKNDEEKAEVISSDTKGSEKEVEAVEFESDRFSVYGIVGTETITGGFVSTDGKEYEVTVTYEASAGIPKDASLKLEEYAETSEEYQLAKTKVDEFRKEEADSETEEEEEVKSGFSALGISIVDAEGNEIEPKSEVSVSIKMKSLPEGFEAEDIEATMEVHHLAEADGTITVEKVAAPVSEGSTISADENSALAEFTTDSFSTYVVTWGNNQRVTLHFVDDKGNELSGIKYNGTTINDGQTTVAMTSLITTPSTALDLTETFTKDGYTYSNTYLDNYNGTGNPVGTCIGNALYRSSNNSNRLRYKDAPDSNDYTNLDNGDHIYLVYSSVPGSSGGGGEGGGDSQAPDLGEIGNSKEVTSNGDGTYDVALSVAGTAQNKTEETDVNVIFIVDCSNSMTMWGRTRLADTKVAVNNMANELLKNNTSANQDAVELALIKFNNSADIVPVGGANWTSTYSTFGTAVNGLTSSAGTNWEEALQKAEAVDKGDGDPTYVIFFTDGDPTQYQGHTDSTNYQSGEGLWAARDEARRLVNSGKYLYGIFAYGDDTSKLSGLIDYGYNDSNAHGTYFYDASDTSAVEAALAEILDTINMNFAYADVKVHDGITGLTSVTFEEVDPESFRYKITYKDYTSSTNYTEKTVNITVNNDGSITIPSVTYGVLDNKEPNGWKTVTTEAVTINGATYDATTKAVNWDMKKTTGTGDAAIYMLEDTWNYEVKFKVWPSQESYDLVAALNNGLVAWGSDYTYTDSNGNTVTIPAADYQKQIVKNGDSYSLKTNTDANVKYKQVTETIGEDGKPTYSYGTETTATIDYTGSMALDGAEIKIIKQWDTSLSTEDYDKIASVDLYVLEDNPDATGFDKDTASTYYKKVTLTKANNWEEVVAIAPGVYDGTSFKTTGHTYSVVEPDLDSHYEFNMTPTHPMLNGTTHNDDTDMVETYNTTAPYTIMDRDDENTITYSVSNTLKGGINIKKEIDVADEFKQFVNEDQLFSFTIRLFDGNGDPVYTGEEGHDVSGSLGTRYYKEDGTTVRGGIPETGEVTLTMKASEAIRIVNVPAGTYYTVEEGDLSSTVYSFKQSDWLVRHHPTIGSEDWVTDGSETITDSQTTNSHRIYPNSENNVTFTNTYEGTGYIGTKVWDDNNYADRPETVTFQLYQKVTGSEAEATAYGEAVTVGVDSNGDALTGTTVVDDNTWTYTWKGLPLKATVDGSTVTYEYSFKEVTTPENYTAVMSDDGTTVTNILAKKIRFVKEDMSGNKLEGAEFTLVIGDDTYSLTSDADGLMKTEDNVSEFTMPVSTTPYDLTEANAPDGYNKLTGVVKITVNANSVTAGRSDDSTVTYTVDEPTANAPYYVVHITNSSGVELPMTGGSGTLPYTLGGIALIMASALMYGFRMRRRERRLN